MIYLTDTIGLASGIIGTLIAVSKIFDGFTDIIFGSLIDKTHTKLGKARPWMIYGYIGCAITLIAVFAVPISWGKTAQYAWFFIAYTLLNGVFYTANNIAYSALTSLVTKNSKERVQMGSYRFIFAFSTSLLIQSVTVIFVDFCGGGAEAWRTVAIIYAVIGLIVNTISGLSVKELPEEELISADQSKRSVGSDDLIYQTVAYVSGNFKNTFSLEDMAKDLGVSKYVLSRIFSKTFHSNFKQYLNDTRLDYARRRLENTEDSITNICLDSGFDSQRTFNRVFKERFRVSPTEYRKSQKEKVKLL